MNNILFKFMSTFIFSTLLFTSNLTIAETIQQKKQSFFNLVYPLIETENTSILKTRKRLTSIRNKIKEKKPITDAERNYIEILNDQYSASKNKTDINELVDKLIVKIDVIPPSLAMAQSANESAWGKSRFAVKANNFFGQWCFSKGCGIVPKQRSANSKHEVRHFNSVQESVRNYIKNINTTRAYATLRKIRQNFRLKNQQLDGPKMAAGLLKYSSRGKAYVSEIRAMIKQNKLKKYDDRFWASIKGLN